MRVELIIDRLEICCIIHYATEPYYVVPRGFEPRQTVPKTVVLPLHHRTIYAIYSLIVGKSLIFVLFFPISYCIITNIIFSPSTTIT